MNNNHSNHSIIPLLLQLASVLFIILVFFVNEHIGGGGHEGLLNGLFNISDSCAELKSNELEMTKRIESVFAEMIEKGAQIEKDRSEAIRKAGGGRVTLEMNCTYTLKGLSLGKMALCQMTPECSTEDLIELFEHEGMEVLDDFQRNDEQDGKACKDRFKKEVVANFSCTSGTQSGMSTGLLIGIIVGVVVVLVLVIGGMVLVLVLCCCRSGGRGGGGNNNQNQYNVSPQYGYNPQIAAAGGGKAQWVQGASQSQVGGVLPGDDAKTKTKTKTVVDLGSKTLSPSSVTTTATTSPAQAPPPPPYPTH